MPLGRTPYKCGVLFICARVYQSLHSDRRNCLTLSFASITALRGKGPVILSMKKRILGAVCILLLLIGGCDQYASVEDLAQLENRVAALENLCGQMNTNISSLQTIIGALQNNDYITSVTPVTQNGETVGYTIAFTKSEPITIYHGKDGKNGADGQNGKDGKDGYTPVIGVRQDSDGVYYWTLEDRKSVV